MAQQEEQQKVPNPKIAILETFITRLERNACVLRTLLNELEKNTTIEQDILTFMKVKDTIDLLQKNLRTTSGDLQAQIVEDRKLASPPKYLLVKYRRELKELSP